MVVGTVRVALRRHEVTRDGFVGYDGSAALVLQFEVGVRECVVARHLGALYLSGVNGARSTDLHAERFAFEVFFASDDVFVFFTHQDGKPGIVVGFGKENALGAFGGNRKARGSDVDRSRKNARDDGIEPHGSDLGVVPGLLREKSDEIEIKPFQFVGFAVDVFKRSKSGFGRNAQRGGLRGADRGTKSGGCEDFRCGLHCFPLL